MRNSSKNYYALHDPNSPFSDTLVCYVHSSFRPATTYRNRRSFNHIRNTPYLLSVGVVDGDPFTVVSTEPKRAADLAIFEFSSPPPLTRRPLTGIVCSNVNVALSDMTTAVSAPGSPPDLSGSRSSKSSSYCSTSQFSNPDGILSDISNFEEIGLDDEKQMSEGAAAQTDGKSNLNPAFPTPKKNAPERPPSPTKSVTIGRSKTKPIYHNLHDQGKEAVNHHSVYDRGYGPRTALPARRGFTSPSFPVLPSPVENFPPRTRSSSPIHRNHVSATSIVVSASNLRPSPESSRASLPLPPRPGSWNPRRKSVQELEAEYHDSDEELPDETNLWNVPMSPRPPEERISPSSSSRGSPERYYEARSPRPIPLAHASTAPESPPPRVPHFRHLPKIRTLPPRSSSLQASTFLNGSPPSPKSHSTLRAIRAKSWTMAMSELSEEARILSEALEYHAGTEEREREGRVQAGHLSDRPSLESRSNRSSYSTIQLPPVQRGELDFLPMSKEKEAVLSRTRPSWLPPKDPREERRHLKEYQKMMAASIEAERRREQKLLMRRCARDNTREALKQVWQHYVESGGDALDSKDVTRDLWWQGVSSKVRGQVWERAIGNQLMVTDGTYERALKRARAIQSRNVEDLNDAERTMLSWFRDIERDAETAFPELNLFQLGGPLWQDLVDVCKAYACYRSDIGYVYGVQLIGALLLLQLHTPSRSFVLLANCFNRPSAQAFLANDLGTASRTYDLAMSTLTIKFPRLHDYLFCSMEKGGLSMTAQAIFEPMFRTLFSNGLDVDRLCRIWDCWVFEGDRILIHAAVAVLGILQHQIFDMGGSFDLKRRNVQEMLGWGPFGRQCGYWDLSTAGDVEAFMDEVREAGKLDYTGR